MNAKLVFSSTIMEGLLYQTDLAGWRIAWESKGIYRHWCFQQYDVSWQNILVVMLNPGSLSGNGENLAKDTTLSILRKVCGCAKVNPFIINLFDYSDAKPPNLYANWEKRDGEFLIINKLELSYFAGVVYAYGDCAKSGVCKPDIQERIRLFRIKLESLKSIPLPLNNSGNPKHPMNWQRQKLIEVVQGILIEQLN